MYTEIYKDMPDLSHEVRLDEGGALGCVGMTAIEMPVWVVEPWGGERFRQAAKVDAFVSLDDPLAKGIHMSRLYLALQDRLQSELVSLRLLGELLGEFIQSQRGLSQSASVLVQFAWPVQREALLSGERGWRQYPVELSAKRGQGKTQYFSLCGGNLLQYLPVFGSPFTTVDSRAVCKGLRIGRLFEA